MLGLWNDHTTQRNILCGTATHIDKFDGHSMDKPSSLDKRSHLRVALSLRHRMQEMHWIATCASKHGKHGAKECIDTLDTMDYDGMCFSWFFDVLCMFFCMTP